MRIPTDGQRILQTDASDEYWRAILLEKHDDKEFYCAHASGQFNESEKHYHVIYKETLAIKYGIKKFEFHLIVHNFLVWLDSSSFPKILKFKNKVLPTNHLLRLKTWFLKYDFTVQHIKGDQNFIPDLLSRPSSSSLKSSFVLVPVIFMTPTLSNTALTKKSFPYNLTFSSPYQIQDFVKKFIFRYFMNIYRTQLSEFPSFHSDHLFLTGMMINPSRDITEDELWYLWCLIVLYATKLIFPIQPMFQCLIDPNQAHSLTWTLFEWFPPLSWWRKQLNFIIKRHHINLLPDQEGEQFTSVFIVHRPYFQHLVTKSFWTQDQAYEWKTAPHSFPLNHDPNLVSTLKQYLFELNNA